MAGAGFDVVGVGNAIVDVLAEADDALLERLGLDKGVMTLVDEARAAELYRAMGPAVEKSGGSAANTLAGLASLGGRGAYIGKVRDDAFGEVFRHDMEATGVTYRTPPARSGPSTARCLVFVTPDARRTMQTCLGISVELGPEDIDREIVREAHITYLEGYLFDRPEAKRAFVRASEIAHASGRRVALSLSDPFCVERHRASFRHLVEGHVDILFANEAEVTALYRTASFGEALRQVGRHCEVVALTRSRAGSVVVCEGEERQVDAVEVPRLVDTTGAGDQYAAGFLFGLVRGYPVETCGRLGSLAAAEVIQHYGARPETSLARLACEAGLDGATPPARHDARAATARAS